MKEQKTYLTESFVCAITTCADDIGGKTGPQFPTDLWIDDRHVHRSQLINIFTTSASFPPASHLAHFIFLQVYLSAWKLDYLYIAA